MPQIHEMFESIGEEKNKVLNWVEVAKWVASIWNSSPCPDAFLSFPAPPELICTTSVHQVKSASHTKLSFLMCLPWASGLRTRREAGMEEKLIYSKGITRFPSLTSTPGLTAALPAPDLRRQRCSDSSGRTLLIGEAQPASHESAVCSTDLWGTC